MRRRGIALIALAALLLAARLFTGIFYTTEDTQAYLVLKPAPDWAVERVRSDDRLLARATVLSADENDIAFGGLYRGAMAAAPFAAAALAAAGLWLARRRRG